MKLVTWKEMFNLPVGTLYIEMNKNEALPTRPFHIKVEQWEQSWWASNQYDLEDFGHTCGGAMLHEAHDRLLKGQSVANTMNSSWHDKNYDEDKRMFLVYEPNDVRRLIEVLQEALASSTKEGTP